MKVLTVLGLIALISAYTTLSNSGNLQVEYEIFTASTTNDSIRFRLTNSNNGYAAIGLQCTEMTNCHIVICNYNANNAAQCLDYIAPGHAEPVLQTTSNEKNISGTRSDHTVYVFERLLNTGIAGQAVLTLNDSNNFIWAGGVRDTIEYHEKENHGLFSARLVATQSQQSFIEQKLSEVLRLNNQQ